MNPFPSKPDLSAPSPRATLVPDLLGMPSREPGGVWGMWLRLTVPTSTADADTPLRRERLRRARLLSSLQLTALILIVALLPRGVLPVIDPGTLIGILVFAILMFVSIAFNRLGRATTAAWIYVGGLTLAIAGSQLFTPSGKIGFEDLAGYDFLVIPILICGFILPRMASVYLWLGCVIFIVLDLGLAEHGPSLNAYLPHEASPFLSIYPVAIYPIILTAIVTVISWLSAGSVARALVEATRTSEVEHAYSLLAEQNQELETAMATLQHVHARIANGDLSARAPVQSGQLLMPVALSLNLMLERLAHLTASQGTLAELEQHIAWLSEATARLAQGDLAHPVPQRQVGYLQPIAEHVERIRLGLIQVTQYAAAQIAQIQAANEATRQQMQALERQPQALGEMAPRLQQSIDAALQMTRGLQQYLQRFNPV